MAGDGRAMVGDGRAMAGDGRAMAGDGRAMAVIHGRENRAESLELSMRCPMNK